MENLWLAILFYSVGLAIILHLRPALMFNENGSWKEFGYKRDSRHTLLPFWLFAIGWAVLSYAIATAIAWSYNANASVAMTGTTTAAAAYYNNNMGSWSSGPDDDDDEEMMQPVSEVPVKRGRGRPRKTESQPQPRTGYYVVEPAGPEGGLRRYVYYGSTPPPVEERLSPDSPDSRYG